MSEKKCSKCGEVKPYSEFTFSSRHKTKCYSSCKKCCADRQRERYRENPQKFKDAIKKSLKKRRLEGLTDREKQIEKSRRKLTRAIKIIKELHEVEDSIGLSIIDFKKYIERQFDNKMNWSNYREWHIDHIIPLASATTEEEVIKLNHYTNLQPLWAEDNISKNDKIIEGTQTGLQL